MKQALVILAVLVIAGLGFALTRDDNKNETQNTNTSNTQQATPSPAPSNEGSSQTTTATAKEITYSDDGFSPDSLTVKSGDTVTIKNSSPDPLQFDSNPHPQHTANPELNVDMVNPGESKTFTVTKKGSHGYHNHLNSSETGTLVVE